MAGAPRPDPLHSSARNLDAPPVRMAIVVDALRDPGNLGTLLRAAVASGCDMVVMMPECADVYSPKAIRSAMGATWRIRLQRADSLHSALQAMHAAGVADGNVWAAMPMPAGPGATGAATDYTLVDWAEGGSGLVIGSEARGVGTEVEEACRSGRVRRLEVPMEGGVESLNAAVCAAVVMFEAKRQRDGVGCVKEPLLK